MQKLSEQRLGTEKIGRLILAMGIPSVVAQIVNLLYNIVDRIYIGHIESVGTEALTGVGLSMPIIIIITAFSSFVAGGGAPLAAIALGEGDKKRAEKFLANGTSLLLFFSVILIVIIMLIKKPLLYSIGASVDTFPYANDYLTIYLFGTPFVLLTVGLNAFISAQGRSKTAMLSVIIGAVINIILDPVLIYSANLGVKGAALATIISQFCSMLWVLWVLFSKKTFLRIKPSAMAPDIKIIGKIAALGISPFIMQATESLISFVMNRGLSVYGGDLYVGSLTVLQSVMQFITVPAGGFAQGIQPIISYNYGAGNKERVKKTFKLTVMIVMIYNVIVTGFAIICPQVFARIFTEDTALIELVSRVLPVFLSGMLVFGLQITCQNTFMALGQAKVSLFIALLRKVFLLVPLAIILPEVFNNVMGIYYAEPISDIISALTCTLLFFTMFDKILNKENSAN